MRSTRSLLSIVMAGSIAISATSSGCSSGEEVFKKHRSMMVREQIESRGIDNGAVLAAMREVPRHLFVAKEYMSLAYIDSPLPIGEEQTISQPYIVALMTASLEPGPQDRILEIGTGSGYQAAVLATIVDSVFTIEIIPSLASGAEGLLDSLGYDKVMVKTGDGYYGWPAKGPFDGIIVTAAAPRLPVALTSQLRTGGRLVIPVGSFPQKLLVYVKRPEGLDLISSTSVRFVPMTGRIRETKGNEDAE